MAKKNTGVAETVKDLNVAMGQTVVDTRAIMEDLDRGSNKVLLETLTSLTKISGKVADVNAITEDLLKTIKNTYKDVQQFPQLQEALNLGIKTFLDHNKKITAERERQAKLEANTLKFAKEVGKAMDHIVKSNQEIYQTSHKMQLEGNVTWKEFTNLYNKAYQSARQLNNEIGKQLFTAGEMVKVQEKLITQGFKGLDATTLSSVTGSVSMLVRTMGDVDDRLLKAFEGSYKMFSDSTGIFIKSLGDRLNTFSDSFGMTVQMLQGTVAEMMSANTFLARNNMQAQLRASESLMQAAALTTEIGIASPNFINQLAKTSQFGTASQMSGLFQTGALLQGFSTTDFQSKMLDRDYFGATKDLTSSIYNTLSSMEPGYLKNEYMQRIGEGFGLSQDDILNIMTHGENLDEYSLEIQEKLAETQNSMEEELTDLHMTLKEQLTNLWENSGIAQGIGRLMNETGLYGLLPSVTVIAAGVTKLAFKDTISNFTGMLKSGGVGGTISSLAGKAGGAVSSLPAIAKLGLGGAAGIGGHMLGDSIQQNLQTNDVLANVGGGLAKVGGLTAMGASIGSVIFPGIGTAVGAGIGALAGIADTVIGGIKRSRAQEELALQEKDNRINAERARLGQAGVSPEVDAINSLNNTVKAFHKNVTNNQINEQSLSITLNTRDIVHTGGGYK